MSTVPSTPTRPQPDGVRPPVARRTRGSRQWWVLAVFIVGCQLAGLLGLPFTDSGRSSWYEQLHKPPFNPPSAVFGPVWTTLYLSMAVAAWLVWRTRDRARTEALVLFTVQLALNAAWSPIFFGAERPGWALIEIAALWLAVVATTVRFWTIDRMAGLLLAPYAAWVAFATVLNWSIVVLN